MVQIYLKHTDNEFYLLDLEESELINYKLTVKDLTDITKIFSPFTQSFTIKATDKNKILCGFVGNEKILRANNTGSFDAMIYISGFLFQSGKLTFEETDYEFNDQKTFKTIFESNLTSLVDKLGDSTIQELFQDVSGEFDPLVKVEWNRKTLRDRMVSLISTPLSNGIPFKWGIPFISNERVWNFDETDLTIVDNIAYKESRSVDTLNFINLNEVRPAVTYMTIMKHLLLKIGTPVTCPLFENPELNEAFVWCNAENLVSPDSAAYPISGYNALTYLRDNTKDDPDGVSLPTIPKWTITGGDALGVFMVKRNNSIPNSNRWGDGFDISLKFNNLEPLEGTETEIKVNLRRMSDNVIINSQDVTTDTYTWRIIDDGLANTMLDNNDELLYQYEILPVTLLNWDSLTASTIQRFRYDSTISFGIRVVTRADFHSTATNNTLSSLLGGNSLNLITALPKIKCIDFLKSFFKTFNISVVSTGLQDQSTYWLTPSNIQEVNKPYSKRIVDYTLYVNPASLPKKKANKYNQYVFSHKDSKYYESVYGDGTRFGELKYPTIAPDKPTKFEVKTDYSIIKQSVTFSHPANVRTCLGFINEAPTVLDNGANRYKTVYDEFTIFYLKNKSLGLNSLSLEYLPSTNFQLFGILEASFKNYTNGKTFAFGAESLDTDSLYLNYYSDFIELLLRPNTYSSEFTLNLPANEIFLNFANLNQGESNIPTGFRAQNEIIIGEQRYSLVDSAINLITGTSKLTLLNF